MELLINLLTFLAILVSAPCLAGWSACAFGNVFVRTPVYTSRRAELICLLIYAGACTLFIGMPTGGPLAAFAALFLIAFSVVLLFYLATVDPCWRSTAL